jgi:diguanylate cyclase (GGDEF)-like protein
VTRRAAVLAALAAAYLAAAGSPSTAAAPGASRPAAPTPSAPGSITSSPVPVAAVGAPIAVAASPPAASLLHPAALHAAFRVPPAGTALYVGTPWYIRDLTVVVTGPGSRRTTIGAAPDLPGRMLGLRLPPDAWQAERIDLDATTVSTAAPPYLLPAEQLAEIGWRNWSYAAFFGLFAALALLAAILAVARAGRAAAWYAAATAAQAGLLIPWLGVVRPPPEISQPVHAALQSLFWIALTAIGLAYLCGARRLPRVATAALWMLTAANVAAVVAGDVLQDLYPLPDIATQALAAALAIAYVALASTAVRANRPGARWYLAGTALAALAALAGDAFATPLPQSAAVAATAAEAILLALALVGALPPAATPASAPRRAPPPAGRTAAGTAAAGAATPATTVSGAESDPAPALVDGLTELANRPALDRELAAAWEHARRTQTPLAALLVDVDRFHAYNDAYGHLAGDDVLRRVAAALTATAAREEDVAGRYAGDKFLALLPDTDPAGARHVADAVRDAILALNLAHGAAPTKRVTASIAVAAVIPSADDRSANVPTAPTPHADDSRHTPTPARPALAPTASDPADLIRRLETALHIAKAMGRNRVVADEPAAPHVSLP